MTVAEIKALTFNVFGTVVDYRSAIIAEGQQINQAKGLDVDWARFADAWRGQYAPSMDKVIRGALPWTNIDGLHRMILDQLLVDFAIDVFTDEEKAHLNLVWHRLAPWPDAIEGLVRLRERFVVATLSNGNIALLTKHGQVQPTPVGLYPLGGVGAALQTRSTGVFTGCRVVRGTTTPDLDGRRA
ncbi:MAG: haloacid dehalogenase type II [Chloroflexi bacterium AL-W]|nr:haloacid dehalogenase type II [Chloroflexi bacterium AL-N1]NOK66566.1 haloacid dehalogenase type II [Chloroflexi bacterium AL-N10]NOK71954.1 haloacid dehalogenase type II [Chloroflexi bacterium AL-N5]NOK81211.1 haloacid dehalogenase type II [Chloroflexi bacterium AL-W]NOK89484.1 haloacid dehalogenase type II [Chloroflexi bacterium AL-N15]